VRPALLIAGNFVRENRWPVIVLFLWGLANGLGAITLASHGAEESLFFLKQQAMYGVFLTLFLASSTLHNQRRTRRILAVLSKGITRFEYLSGIILGFSGVSLLYGIVFLTAGALTLQKSGANPWLALPLMTFVLVASILAGTVALFFSTFMPPLLALAATGVALGISAVLSGLLGKSVTAVVPFYQLISVVSDFSLSKPAVMPWAAATWGIIYVLVFWVTASWIFSRRDVAVAVE
jgi:hypothetical protein